jgi:hypothetical protein
MGCGSFQYHSIRCKKHPLYIVFFRIIGVQRQEKFTFGAMNILERGHRLLARGEMVHLGRSKKQEPAEVNQFSFNWSP